MSGTSAPGRSRGWPTCGDTRVRPEPVSAAAASEAAANGLGPARSWQSSLGDEATRSEIECQITFADLLTCTVSLGLIARKGLRYKLLAADGSRRKERRDGATFSGSLERAARRCPGPPRRAPRRAAAVGRLLATLPHGLANTPAADQ